MTVRVRDQNPCCLIAYNQLIHPVLFKIVATLERDFEQTVAYYALDGVARELLRTTSSSMHEIALRAAFGTQMTFHRIFTALRGMTPEEYRERWTKC